MLTAAETIFRQVLRQSQPALEHARAHLLLGETLLRAGSPDGARSELGTAAAAFEAAGALYWAARA